MTDGAPPSVLQIKKYPNRRFYDATRSSHVTLQELYQLVLEGRSICVTDSRTGEDITNIILVQIMLEKDPPKLHLFPAWVFHALLRSTHTATRQVVDQMFGPFTQAWVRGQRSVDDLTQTMMSGRVTTPMDWAENMMRFFSAGYVGPGTNGRVEPAADAPGDDDDDLAAIQSQVAELNDRLARLKSRGSATPGG